MRCERSKGDEIKWSTVGEEGRCEQEKEKICLVLDFCYKQLRTVKYSNRKQTVLKVRGYQWTKIIKQLTSIGLMELSKYICSMRPTFKIKHYNYIFLRTALITQLLLFFSSNWMKLLPVKHIWTLWKLVFNCNMWMHFLYQLFVVFIHILNCSGCASVTEAKEKHPFSTTQETKCANKKARRLKLLRTWLCLKPVSDSPFPFAQSLTLFPSLRPPAGRPEPGTLGGSRPSHSPMSSGCHNEWSWHGRYANPLSFKLSQEAGT